MRVQHLRYENAERTSFTPAQNEVELIRTQDGVGKQMLEICENIDGVKKNQLTQPRGEHNASHVH